jgi:hypothetical protein
VKTYLLSLPERLVRSVLGLGAGSAAVGAARTGKLFGAALLDHYRSTLDEIREAGYATFAARQLAPYVRAAVGQFSPERITLTERLLTRDRQSR